MKKIILKIAEFVFQRLSRISLFELVTIYIILALTLIAAISHAEMVLAPTRNTTVESVSVAFAPSKPPQTEIVTAWSDTDPNGMVHVMIVGSHKPLGINTFLAKTGDKIKKGDSLWYGKIMRAHNVPITINPRVWIQNENPGTEVIGYVVQKADPRDN
jgi:hypothetical protein